MFGIEINKMKEELEDLVEYIIHRAEFHAGSNEDEKLANSSETKEMIEQYSNKRLIEEFEKLRNTYVQLGRGLLFIERIDRRIKELKK